MNTQSKIRWTRSQDAHQQSIDGRYVIEPLYAHGTRPWAYKVADTEMHYSAMLNTMSECRRWAEKRYIPDNH